MENIHKNNFHTGTLSRRHLSSTRIQVGPNDMSRMSLNTNSNTATLANNVSHMQDVFKNLHLQLHKQKIDLVDRAKSLKFDEKCPYCGRIGQTEFNYKYSDKGFDNEET